jgi:hypothetical protein
MTRVVVQTTMSLDGCVAGPNHEMDWVFEHSADVPPGLVEESIASTGAVLGGRRAYEVSPEDHLVLIDASRTGQVLSLRYRVAKRPALTD